MAASPRYKVYSQDGVYMASCKELEAAAALVALYGDGATIRDGHTKLLYRNGTDGEAGDSYDAVVEAALHKRGEAIR